MGKSLFRSILILFVLIGIFSGCSGGGDAEQDRPAGLTGPVRLVSIYPSGGPVGATVSICATGTVSEAILQFCDQPITAAA
ncbi:MAG: hypothetical protein HYT76_09275, partial [Deltaproteobacteria bacterium]|nr:hypothetical protein [Deltaproteobacteria bacterium]